jgi:hypothetical protein
MLAEIEFSESKWGSVDRRPVVPFRYHHDENEENPFVIIAQTYWIWY